MPQWGPNSSPSPIRSLVAGSPVSYATRQPPEQRRGRWPVRYHRQIWLLPPVPALQKIDLRKLMGLNIATKHGSYTPLSWKDAADMARLSRGLLLAIIENGRGGAPA